MNEYDFLLNWEMPNESFYAIVLRIEKEIAEQEQANIDCVNSIIGNKS
jgi:hypothetical protein